MGERTHWDVGDAARDYCERHDPSPREAFSAGSDYESEQMAPKIVELQQQLDEARTDRRNALASRDEYFIKANEWAMKFGLRDGEAKVAEAEVVRLRQLGRDLCGRIAAALGMEHEDIIDEYPALNPDKKPT